MNVIVVRVVLALVIVAIVGFYCYEVFALGTDPTEYLFRTISIVCLCLAGIIRTGSRSRNSLQFYDDQYQDILKDAFVTQPFWRKKLLCAVRLFNEGNYQKAVKYLSDLKDRCQSPQDAYAVYLFAALSFTNMELLDLAESLYQQLINADLADSRIYSNLGSVQNQMGKVKKALQNYEYALEYDRRNENAWNNIAQLYFGLSEFDKAIPYAEKALEINAKMYQASTLLAIIYAIKGDRENQEKYSHMAISAGRSPKELQECFDHYCSQYAGKSPETPEKQNESSEMNA